MEPELAVVLTLIPLTCHAHSEIEGGEGNLWEEASYCCMLVTVRYQCEEFCMAVKLRFVFPALPIGCLPFATTVFVRSKMHFTMFLPLLLSCSDDQTTLSQARNAAVAIQADRLHQQGYGRSA